MSTQYHGHRIVPIPYSGYVTCSHCKGQFWPEAQGQAMCRLCRVEQAHRPSVKPQEQATHATRVQTPPAPRSRCCDHCGASYTAHPKASQSRYCSATCRLERKKTAVADKPCKTFQPRTCPSCESTYTPTGTRQRLCAGCQKIERREYMAAYKRQQRQEGRAA